ncbi:MAG TPA: YdeI/OmpD-associated family protein [Saprospiraceae bacterium]|nr:YdeI/OmpD-associated family protein [Saprospiraceae bacterium]HPI07542.1 YdeI/OmpD-associated family protein [Saprospiraceae bacterium]
MNSKVDKYFSNAEKWGEELEQLRTILLDCGLDEELKWGSPCYSFQNNNIAIIGELKESCVIGFFKGVLLSDAHGILVQPGENTQSARSVHFTSAGQIREMEPVLKEYIYEAIEVEKAGLEVPFKKTSEFSVPEEFQRKLDEMPALKKAFEALTPGRQRGYLLHFSAPKQSKTREARIEKCMQQILDGKGLND